MRWLLVLMLAACKSKSPSDVMAEEKPKMAAVHAQLVKIADAIKADPMAGGNAESCKVPGLTYEKDHYDKGKGTLEVMQLERIREPTVDLKEAGVVKLLYSPYCEMALYWTHANNDLKGGDADGMARVFAGCRKATHVVVASQLKHDRAAGDLEMRYYLASIADGKILCSFGSNTHVDPKLTVVEYETVQVNTRTGERKHFSFDSQDEYASSMLSLANGDAGKAISAAVGIPVAY